VINRENPLTSQLCSPEKLDPVLDIIDCVVAEDTSFAKGALELRYQRNYGLKVYGPSS
jgi:hypothetical protein